MLKGYWLPTIRAAIELNRKRPGNAIGLLQAAPAAPAYELGTVGALGLPIYLAYGRGEACLQFRLIADWFAGVWARRGTRQGRRNRS
jgi:hypothetical protein